MSLLQYFVNFAEWVDFAYWWRCIEKGLRLQPAKQAFFLPFVFGGAINTAEEEEDQMAAVFEGQCWLHRICQKELQEVFNTF